MIGEWWVCDEPTCPFESNSEKQAAKHETDTGHEVYAEES